MNHPRTAILALALTLTAPAFAQIHEPPICEGPGATAACHQALKPLDLLATSKHAPTDPLELGAYLLEHDQAPEAREILLDELPRVQEGERDTLLFLLGVAEHEVGNYAEAASTFHGIRTPTFASRYNYAVSLAKAGDPAGTESLRALLADVLEAQRGTPDVPAEPLPAGDATPALVDAARLLLDASANLNLMSGDHEQALSDTMTSLTLLPRTPALYAAYVAYSLEVVPPEDALVRAHRLAPEEHRALLLARAYDRAGQLDYAREHYQEAERRAHEVRDADTIAEIAAFHARQGDWLSSEESTRDALDLDPNQPTALYLSGLQHERNARPAEALVAYEHALENGSSGASTLVRIAITAHQAERHTHAINAAEGALLESGTHPIATLPDTTGRTLEPLAPEVVTDLLVILTHAHHALSETDEALAFADALANHESVTPTALAYIADLHHQQGLYADALTHYQRASELATTPDLSLATRQAYAHLALEQYDDARTTLTPFVQSHPEQAGETLHLIAWTYALEGEAELALQAWERAATAGSDAARAVLAKVE